MINVENGIANMDLAQIVLTVLTEILLMSLTTRFTRIRVEPIMTPLPLELHARKKDKT